MTEVMGPQANMPIPGPDENSYPVSEPIKSESPGESHEGELERGRRRSRSAGGDDDDGAEGSNGHLEGPSRKRRRSRKGLDKKFECPHEGCGKSYSRAEHLYRHQLNHNPKQIYVCDFPDCTRTFVRLDLCNRHKDRHTAKGSALHRKDMLASQTQAQSIQMQPPSQGSHNFSDTISPTTVSTPFSMTDSMTSDVKPDARFMKARSNTRISGSMMGGSSMQQHHMGFPASAPLHPVDGVYGNTMMVAGRRIPQQSGQMHSPGGIGPQRSQAQTGMDMPNFNVISPVSGQSFQQQAPHSAPQRPINFMSQQNFPAFNLPPSNFNNSRDGGESRNQSFTSTTNEEYQDSLNPSTEMMVLEQIQTLPMFGSETLMNKSPYFNMPNDLINYLFYNASPIANTLAYQNAGYSSYSQMYMGPNANVGYLPNLPSQIMAVNNLLEQNLREATISDEKSGEIFNFVKERFVARGSVPEDRKCAAFMNGNRSESTHAFSKRMMQAYIGSYWLHFSDQVPIIHKPSFSPDDTHILLLLAMMAIGAACLDKTSRDEKMPHSSCQLSNFLVWHIRWEAFMDPDFQSPAKLWAFQALTLAELYEKMYSTRELHERALVHHATIISVMRRGCAFMDRNTSMESPSSNSDRRPRQNSTSEPSTTDEWWERWIINESRRRTSYAAFIIDSIHAKMFGHSSAMVVHEIRLPLPCDDKLWKATSSSEAIRLDTIAASNSNDRPVSLLEGLKRILHGESVETNFFGRTVLMAGLLSVSWHMEQRDLHVTALARDAKKPVLGARDVWRSSITKAFDFWKQDFDKAIEEAGNDPYRGFDPNRREEFNVVFESRTVLHHLAHISMHVDVIDCQIYARAKRLLGRSINEADWRRTQGRMRDWHPTAKARDATWYALNFLCTVLIPAERGLPRLSDFNPDDPYSAKDDVLLNRPWVVYLATLVVWSYAHAREGPCVDKPVPANKKEAVAQMKDYLVKYGSIQSPDGLEHITGLNNNIGLLMVLKESFEATRWQLLNEGAVLLNNCIQVNTGAMR